MGNAASHCFTRQRDGGGCCDRVLPASVFGEDAFYRDAFFDCEEGNKAHDGMFNQAHQQTRLKYKKASLLANYASFEIKRRASSSNLEVVVGGRNTPRVRLRDDTWGDLEDEDLDIDDRGAWVGRTIQQWTGKGLPETNTGAFWSKGDGRGLRVRCGPDYRKNGHKQEPSQPPMYEAVSCDAVRSDDKIQNLITDYGCRIPPPPQQADSDRGGGSALQWTKECPLPRVVCINMMLPYTTGVVPMRKDAGCSFVGFFHITPQTIREAQRPDASPAVRLFKQFWDGPAGVPGGDAADPNRSLYKRLDRRVKKDQQSGLLKAIAHCVNPADVNVPEMFHTYNGKPCVITKCGYVVKDPEGEWLEIGIDVRGFNILARRMLCSFRQMLPRTNIHYGFVIQGIEEEELPEGLICDMFVHGIDMVEDPKNLSRNSTPGRPVGPNEKEGKEDEKTRLASASSSSL